MITEHDLVEAIAECQGERNPNANTCIKLAAFYTIRNELFGKSEQFERAKNAQSYSYASESVETVINYESGTEFSEAINGRSSNEVLAIMDELMDTVKVLMPRLYDGVMRKLQG